MKFTEKELRKVLQELNINKIVMIKVDSEGSRAIPLDSPLPDLYVGRFGSNVKMRLKLIKMTQSELARRIGVTRAAISHIVLKSHNPTLRNAIMISKELGMTLEELCR